MGFPAAPTFYPTGGPDVQALAVGDVTTDGQLGLVTADATDDRLRVLPSTGTGRFGPAVSYAVRNGFSTPNGVALAT